VSNLSTLSTLTNNDLAIEELKSTGKFETMSLSTDEDEHSIELHLPYVRKIFEGMDIRIVPVLVGAINKDTEASFGALLAPYLAREDTFTVVSSDFCHWYVSR
jgi:AmmeMemoRadiSam system protein B